VKTARRLWPGFIPIPVLVAVIGAVFLSVDRSLFFEPAWLLPLTNTLFVTVICLLVALIAVGNFAAAGSLQMLWLGTGVLAFGSGAAAAGFLRDVPGLGANLNVTISNCSALVGAVFHCAAALALLAGAPAGAAVRRRGLTAALWYGGALLFVAALTLAALRGILPRFFIQGSGPTPLRQWVLGSADLMFVFSSVVFLVRFARNGEPFLFWYACALALTGISLTAFFIQTSVGSAIGWTGRFSQYVGGAYFLAAVLTALRSARARGTSLNTILSSSFKPGEETFRTLAENTPDIIRRFDRGLRPVYANPAGSGSDAGFGKAAGEEGSRDPSPRLWRERIMRVFDTGEVVEARDLFRGEEGARLYQSRFLPEYGPLGTVENVLVVTRDQTEHERAVEGLRASGERYRALFLGMTEGFALHEVVRDRAGTPIDYRFLEVNPAFETLTGLSSGRVVGRLHSEVLPDDDPKWVRIYGRVALTGEPASFEDFSPALNRHLAVFAYRPAPLQFAVLFMDITERKRMEEELRRAHGELERRVEERTVALRRSNRVLRLLSECNRALVTLDNEEELVRAICQIMHEEGGFCMAWVGYAENDAEKSVRPVAHAGHVDGYLDAVRVSWADSERGRGPAGTAIREGRASEVADFLTAPMAAPWREEALRRGYRSSLSLPLLAEGRPFGALSVYAELPAAFDAEQVNLLRELAGDMAYGITALRARLQRDAMARNLEEKTVRLRGLAAEIAVAEERERRRLARVLHDELQQLIVGARYALGSLREQGQGVSFDEAAARVDAVLGETLEVSRSLASELTPPIRHNGLLGPVLEWLGSVMRQKYGLSVEIQDGGESSLKEEGLVVLLYQAVRELLFNVVKHSGTGVAAVSIRERGGTLTVVVEDRGKGFDTGLPEPDPGKPGGTGILAIRERIGLFGGSLDVRSAPGMGSTFTLSVPVDEDDAWPLLGEERAHALPGRRGRIRVLLADDHPVVRRGLFLALRGQPDIVVIGEAQEGRQAVDLACRERPDVVIMDARMPGLSGVEAAREIRAACPEVRVIGFSAFEDEEQSRAMREAGASAYIAKSDPPGRLLFAIRSCAAGVTGGAP
jgi:PAS domain S-box-containing protein